MVNAIVLLKVRRDRINEVAQELVDIDGVSEVYSVAGQHDLVAILRAKDDEQFAGIVTEGMLKVEGITAIKETEFIGQLNKMEIEKQAHERSLGYSRQSRDYRFNSFLQSSQAEAQASNVLVQSATGAAKTGLTGYARSR